MTSLFVRLFCLIWVSLCFAEFNSAHKYSREPFSCDVVLYMALQSKGVLTLSFDPSRPVTDSIQILETNTNAGFMPGWITQYHEHFYSVSRTEFPTPNSVLGGVFAFQKSGDTNLTLLNYVDSGGQGAVYTDVSRDGRTISVANIDGSTVSIHSREEDGSIGDATYVFKYTLSKQGPGTNGSQVQSNPHEAIFDPSGEFLFVPDRGADLLYVYHVASSFDVAIIQTLRFEPGTGPRHLTFRAFNETRTYMYLVSELDNSIRVFTVDGVRNNHRGTSQGSPRNITISLTQRVSTLGANLNRTAPNNRDIAAEVALSNDGKFAYVSNRNTVNFNSDTVAIYSVHPGLNNDRNNLRYLGYNLTYGKTPRHFSLSKDPQTRYAAFGNEVSNNLVILERSDLTGFFTEIKGNLSVGALDITQNSGPTAII